MNVLTVHLPLTCLLFLPFCHTHIGREGGRLGPWRATREACPPGGTRYFSRRLLIHTYPVEQRYFCSSKYELDKVNTPALHVEVLSQKDGFIDTSRLFFKSGASVPGPAVVDLGLLTRSLGSLRRPSYSNRLDWLCAAPKPRYYELLSHTVLDTTYQYTVLCSIL